ncbi:MAG: regulatory protein RecX, partial [Oscillospiraceae bacterium]|nr:regulatory protein RecX [Oscillospiraceae bacterium]
KARKWALDYLKRPHSEKEVRTKLRERGCAEEDIDAVCAQCVDYGFINDREYAGSIVRYYAGGGYGPGRIRAEFSRRGVPRELWEEALAEFPEGNETIDRLLASRLRGRDISDRRERDKAAAALFRKGYSWEDIRAAMARMGREDDPED